MTDTLKKDEVKDAIAEGITAALQILGIAEEKIVITEQERLLSERGLVPIEKLKFKTPAKTNYKKALNGQLATPVYSNDTWVGIELAGLVLGNLILSGLISLIWVSFIAWLIIFVCIFIGVNIPLLMYNNKETKRRIQKVLGDRVTQFEYHISKAIKIFNTRVVAYNHLLEGCKRGLIQKDYTELERIKDLLLKTRVSLKAKPRLLQWLNEADGDALLSDAPQLTLSLAEVNEVEKDLLASMEELASAEPQMRILENEVASDELEQELKVLLPEHTDKS